MIATAASVSSKRTSGRSTSRCRPNIRRLRKLGAKTCRTNWSNIFRWYRAGWGRYSQADPIGLAGGMTLYQYGEENPINATDPLGLIGRTPSSQQKTRACTSAEYAQCEAQCQGKGVESCRVNQTFRVVRQTNGKTVWAWVDGPMSCSCNDPSSCANLLRQMQEWLKKYGSPLPLPFLPIPPTAPLPRPVAPGLPPFFINPCQMNPSLCFGPGGEA